MRKQSIKRRADLARALDNWAAQGRLLLRRVAAEHAENGLLRSETCNLMGAMGHLVDNAPAGPVGAYVAGVLVDLKTVGYVADHQEGGQS